MVENYSIYSKLMCSHNNVKYLFQFFLSTKILETKGQIPVDSYLWFLTYWYNMIIVSQSTFLIDIIIQTLSNRWITYSNKSIQRYSLILTEDRITMSAHVKKNWELSQPVLFSLIYDIIKMIFLFWLYWWPDIYLYPYSKSIRDIHRYSIILMISLFYIV
jgi:hypothetical protein